MTLTYLDFLLYILGAGIAQDSHPLNGERSSGEATITYSSIDSIDDRKQPDFIEDAELMTSDNFTPKLNMDTMPMLIKNVNGNEAALDDSELSLAVGYEDFPLHFKFSIL